MHASYRSASETSRQPQRGWALYGVAAGAVLGLAFAVVALPDGRSDEAIGEPLRTDVAPTPPATHVAALDAGVDWSRVERSEDDASRAVAAYER
jgi:hypothetical protein